MSLQELFKKPVVLPGTASQRLRRQIPKPRVETFDEKPSELGCDYASKYIKDEEKLYALKHDGLEDSKDDHASISDVESLSNPTSRMTISVDDQEDLYKRYPTKRRKHNNSLPIFEQKRDILGYIDSRRVLIIKGATGCGKTTQVPQFILNAARDIRKYCNIVVTQPRRIAAISVAKRVADEMDVEIGTLVGYQVGLERKVSEDTRLLYCTTGVLLQKLINHKNLDEFTHIVLDEIHERDQEMDFLLLVVRRLLNTVSRDTRVILMSATIDTGIFSEYFYTKLDDGDKVNATVVDIAETTKYLIRKATLDEIKSRIPETHGITLDMDNPEIGRKSYLTAVRLIQLFDDIDDAENDHRRREPGARGSVLVFLPGLHEIEEMESCLGMKKNDNINHQAKHYKWKIIPLHSTITQEEQKRVFLPVETGYRKIILSTNIAESSITVVDIDYVIDFCLTKTMVTDPSSNYCHLKLHWASKSNLEQRAGRVGRVSDGRVFRLITNDFYDLLDEEPTPEILRCPLDRLVLQAKLLDMGEPKAIFALALSQPRLENIGKTILTLKEIGALLVTTNKELTPHDGDLTKMGLIMAKLPLDVRLSKLIFMGNLFNVLGDCIIIACALSVKTVFCQPFRNYLGSYNMKLNWADSTCSDCIAFCNAYKLWRKRCTEGAFAKNRKNAFEWAKDHFVELRSLKDIAVLEKEIEQRLKHSGISRRTDMQYWKEKPKQALFIKLAIAAAFYPYYFFRGSQGGQVDEKDAVITLGGHDPFSTVYLQGVPHNQPGLLYKQSIQEKFSECSNRVNVFVDNSSKVFVHFGRSEEASFDERYRVQIPGKISLAVYRAVKMRQQPDFKFKIPVLNPIDASRRYQAYLDRCESMDISRAPSNNPVLRDMLWPWNRNTEPISELIEVIVCHVESPHHFWVQSRYPNMVSILWRIVNYLNAADALEPLSSPKEGRLYAALFDEGNTSMFYRCRILSVNKNGKFDIYFVDYGNTVRNYAGRIQQFGPDLIHQKKIDMIPDLAIECSLAKIKPPNSPAGEGEWSPKATALMNSECLNNVQGNLAIEIYSFVNNIANVKLKIPRHPVNTCFNELLIRRGLAEKCEESYLSVIDHEERKRMRKLVDGGAIPLGLNESRESRRNKLLTGQSTYLEEDLQPQNHECSQEIVLRGPFSPLEMRVYGGTQCSIGKLVRIESASVNSVLLDTNPSDTHERMVVASFVTTNEAGDKLTLRSTTVMPNLPGLPALVCLMFAPMVELRSNESLTKMSGALCGLGRDPNTGRALFADNDIELIFDVELTLNDISHINRIRYWLNKAVCVSDKRPDEEPEEIEECKNKLIEYISQLFEKQYELQELNFFKKPFGWDEIDPDNLYCPISDDSASWRHPGGDFDFVYRMIWGIRLDGDSSVETTAVVKNIKMLRNFALGQASVKSMECILCRVALSNAINAKLHLKSAQHKIRQKRFNIPDEPITGSQMDLAEYRHI